MSAVFDLFPEATWLALPSPPSARSPALIPDAIPLVIESIISPADLPAELRRVRAALPAAGETPEPYLAAGEWVPPRHPNTSA